MSCISAARNLIVASSQNPKIDSHAHSPPPIQIHTSNNSEFIIPSGDGSSATSPRRRVPKRRRPGPSVIQIERAIGAGKFRYENPRDLEEDMKTPFDMSLMNFTGKYEGTMMKKLQQTAEWVTIRTERKFQASGKWILLFTFQWVLPIWALSFLVASGIIKLPFNIPFIEEFLM